MPQSSQKQEVTTRHALLCLRIGVAGLFTFLGGLLIFHAKANFGWIECIAVNETWWKAYYIWHFVLESLAVLCFSFTIAFFLVLLGKTTYTFEDWINILMPVIIYSIFRLCVEILTIFVGFPNQEIWVTLLFLVALSSAVIIYIRVRRAQKNGSLV
jgi:hypothetical protein